MIPIYFVSLGALFSILGAVSYVWGTLKGTTKPNRVTWFLWALFPFIAAAAQIKGSVGWSTLTVFVAGADGLAVFIASFVNKNAYWKTTLRDTICGALALAGMALWYLTRNQDYAIFFAILADFLAGLPTVIKAWTKPQTESGISYFLWFLGNMTGTLCVQKKSFTGYAFSTYLTVWSLGLFLFVSRSIIFRKRKTA